MNASVHAVVFEERHRFRTRELTLPSMFDGHVLVRTRYSFVSPGTKLRVLSGHYRVEGSFPFAPGYACRRACTQARPSNTKILARYDSDSRGGGGPASSIRPTIWSRSRSTWGPTSTEMESS